MAEFVRGFCVIAVSGGLVLLMAPDGNMKKYVKFIVSLCMVSALLSAFFVFSEKAGNIFAEIEIETENEAEKREEEMRFALVKEAKRNMEAELTALLSAHMNIDKEDIYIVARLDAADLNAVEITEISIFLQDMSCEQEAKKYISEMFMGAVKINIMKKGE